MANYSEDEYFDGTNWVVVTNGDVGGSIEEAQPVVLESVEGVGLVRGSVGFDLNQSSSAASGIDYRDYYSFTVLKTGVVHIDLTGLDGLAFTRLFDHEGTQIGHTLEGTSDDKRMIYTLNEGETYYVLVDGYGTSESNYELSIDDATTANGGGELPPDYDYSDRISNVWANPAAADASDDIVGATLVDLDMDGFVEIVGTTGYGNDEQDYYSFEAGASGEVQIDLTDLTDNIFMKLFSAEGDQLAISATGNSDDKQITYSLSEGQVYTVVVDPYYNAESPYHLTIDAAGGGAVKGRRDSVNGSLVPGGDAGESWTNANTVIFADDQIAISGSVGFSDDSLDWYSYTAPQSADLLSVRLSGLSENVSMSLYDSDNQEIWSTVASSADQTKLENVTGDEVYYIKVDADNASASIYDLDISTSEQPVVAVPDTVNGTDVVGGDAGDSFSAATSATPDDFDEIHIVGFTGGQDYRGDYYSFTAGQNNEFAIELSGFDGQLSLKLYDSQGGLMGTTLGHAATDMVLAPDLVSGETYTVGVIPDLFGERVGSSYSLDVTVPGTVTDDTVNQVLVPGGDAGNQLDAAAVVGLSADTVITGYVGGADSADYYHLDLPETEGTLTVDLRDFSTTLSVVSEQGVDPLLRQLYVYPFNGGESYDLVVESSTSDEQSYTFTLDVDATAPVIGRDDSINGSVIAEVDAADQVGGAHAITLGVDTVTVAGSVGFNGDSADYYHVTLPDQAGSGLLDLSDFAATFSVEMDGVMVAMPQGEVPFTFTGNQTYNVRVVPIDGGKTDYTFTLNASVISSEDDVVNGFAVADGDASDQFSNPLPVSFNANGAIAIQGGAGFGSDNGDCYQFTATSNGTLQGTLSGVDSALLAQLYDANGNLLESTSGSSMTSQTFSYAVVANQDYSVVIDPFLGSESLYHLDLVMA